MSILDGYRDFNRKKYIKCEKWAIVYGDVYESRALASILPYFKRIVKAGAGKGWMRAKPGFPVIIHHTVDVTMVKFRQFPPTWSQLRKCCHVTKFQMQRSEKIFACLIVKSA